MAQDAVWDGVAESQKALGAALKKSVLSAQSPTSYQLSVEDADLEKRKVDFQKELSGISEKSPDTIGYAFYVNGQRNSADVYGSTKLFQEGLGETTRRRDPRSNQHEGSERERCH